MSPFGRPGCQRNSLNFTSNHQLLSRVVEEPQVLNRIDVHQQSESVPFLNITRSGEMQLDVETRVTMPISESKVNQLRDLARVVTESLADKETLIYSTASSLINIMYYSSIAYYLVSNLLEPSV
jgi:hypothetical protein